MTQPTETPDSTWLECVEAFAPIIGATIVFLGFMVREAWIDRREKKAALLKTKQDLLSEFFYTVQRVPNFVTAYHFLNAWNKATNQHIQQVQIKNFFEETKTKPLNSSGKLLEEERLKTKNFLAAEFNRFAEAASKDHVKAQALTSLIGIYDENARNNAHMYYQLNLSWACKIENMSTEYIEDVARFAQNAHEVSKKHTLEAFDDEIEEYYWKLKKFVQ